MAYFLNFLTTLLLYSIEYSPLTQCWIINQKKKKPREISADKPVKRMHIIHYCQHNHSMKREGGKEEVEWKTRGSNPQTLQNIQMFGIKRKPSRKEGNKWNLRQLRCSGSVERTLWGGRQAKGGLSGPTYHWQECQNGYQPQTWKLTHHSTKVAETKISHYKKKKISWQPWKS